MSRKCRFCGGELTNTLLDLGQSPLANEYLSEENKVRGQYHYPLTVRVCDKCFLVQTDEYQKPENIFSEYKYFSSFSQSWLDHCKEYVAMIVKRLNLSQSSNVLEIACNDGYLLQYFLPYHIRVKGIDPAKNVIEAAAQKGISVECAFFNRDTAEKMKKENEQYDLIIGNNVLAHVPDIRGFVEGLPCVLKKGGTITMEFPHLMNLIRLGQFDTIYHEHFSYLSLLAVERIFGDSGLKIYDVEQLPTHGGSLRIYATHIDNSDIEQSDRVISMRTLEKENGLGDIETYTSFATTALNIKLNVVSLLTNLKREGKTIAAYGAAAKGNTFLNYCGIKSDFIDFVVDANIHKQGLYLPGSMIPVVGFNALEEKKPDYVVILPWNLRDEIVQAAGIIRNWGGKFITFIPETEII